MKSLTKTIAMACAASVLGLGVAVAQTAPATPDAAPPPAAGDTAAPAADAAPAKPMKPMKKSSKHMKKSSMKKSMKMKKPMAKKSM